MKDFIEKNYPLILRLLLLGAAAFLLANLVSLALAGKFISKPEILPPAQAQNRSQEKSEAEYLDKVGLIFPAPLGQTQGTGEPVTGSKTGLGQALENSDREVSLLGTIIGDAYSVAILSYQGEQMVLQKGEKLGELTVVEIGKSKVVLKKGSRLITLWTQGLEEEPAASPRSGAKTRPGGIDDNSRIITRTMDREKITAFLNQPQQLAGSVNFTPIAKDNQPYGIQVAFLQEGSFLQELGFKAGDILLNINDKDLKTAEDGLLAWQMLKNEDDVSFKIDRNGRLIHVYFKIK